MNEMCLIGYNHRALATDKNLWIGDCTTQLFGKTQKSVRNIIECRNQIIRVTQRVFLRNICIRILVGE